MQVLLAKAQILRIQPLVWRQLIVGADLSLEELHEVLQAAFEWDEEHAHIFCSGEQFYGAPGAGSDIGAHLTDEREVALESFADDELIYRYAAREGWEVKLVFSQPLSLPGFPGSPYCIDGARAAPPEGAGGLSGYEKLVRVTQTPDDPEATELLEWLDGWDPETVDLDAINEDLSELFA